MNVGIKKIKTSTVLFALAVLLVIWIGVQVQSAMSESGNNNKARVVVLKETITLEPFRIIQETDVELKEVARGSLHMDTLVSLKDAIGKRVITGILPSTVLRSGHLLPDDSYVGILAASGNKQLVALNLSVDPEQSELARAGEWVTLHGLIRQGAETTLLRVRKVLVIGKREQVLTVALEAEQAEAVHQVLLQGGNIRMVLNQP